MAYRDRRFTCADAGREADAPLHTLIFAYVLGLRLSEIAAVRMAMHKEQAGRPNFGIKRAVDGHGWDIVVLGKGGKFRTVPIPNAVMNALAAYGEIIGLGADVGAWPKGRIIFQTLGDGSWRVKKSEDYARQPMSESQVYRMFKGHSILLLPMPSTSSKPQRTGCTIPMPAGSDESRLLRN